MLKAQMKLIEKWPERRRCAECSHYEHKARMCAWHNAEVPQEYVNEDNDCKGWGHLPF